MFDERVLNRLSNDDDDDDVFLFGRNSSIVRVVIAGVEKCV